MSEKALVLKSTFDGVQQILDTAALGAGAGASMAASLTTPIALGKAGYWTRSTDGHPMFTSTAGVSYDLLAVAQSGLVPSTFEAIIERPEQAFPTTLAGLQSFFPDATSAKIFTFDEANGNIVEKTGSGQNLTPNGAPKYDLWTPFSPSSATTKKSCSTVGAADGFTGASGASLDPAGGAMSMLAVVRRNAVATAGYVADKYNGAGYLWYYQNQTYHLLVRDGATGIQIDLAKTEYGVGDYVYLLWNFDGVDAFQLMTTEEVVDGSDGAFVAANFTNNVAARILNNQALNLPLLGNIAYLAFMPGPIATQAQLTAFAVGMSMLGSGLTYTPNPAVPRGCVGLDEQDAVFGTRTVKCNTLCRPWDKRYSSFPSLAMYQTGVNTLVNSELPNLWTLTDPSGVSAVVLNDAEAPDGGFSASRLSKTAAGTTPSWSQNWSGFYSPGVGFAVWLRADVAHTAYIRMTSNVPAAFDTTLACAVTTKWQRFNIFASPVAGAANGTVYIYPCDPASNPATGAIHAWGAMHSPQSDADSPPNYTVTQTLSQQGGPGTVVATAEIPAQGSGYIELAWYNLITATNSVPFIKSTAGGGRGGFSYIPNNGTSVGVLTLTTPDGTTASYTPWDVRTSEANDLLTHLVFFWEDADIPGGGKLGVALNGSAPYMFTGQTLPVWMANEFTLMFDAIAGMSQTLIKKLSFGGGPLSADQLIAMATAAGVTPATRVGCIGDSITDGLYHGYFVNANIIKGLGDGQWIWVDQGVSGNTTTQMLARFNADMVGRGYNYACIMGGINDVLFFDAEVQDVLDNLSAMYALAVANGMTVVALTLTPSRNNTFGNWTLNKQVKMTAINHAILAKYDPNISIAVDVTTPLLDPVIAFQGNPALYLGDLLHPNTILQGPVNGADLMGTTVAAAIP